jgi:tetratricopeptide (TPR) repeat protein
MPTTDGAARNPFEVLGLELSADDREVRSAYARKLREARLAGGQDLVQEIQDAFIALRDAEKRGQIRQFLEKQAAVDPHLAAGRKRLEEGEPEEALVHLRKALEVLPGQEGLLRTVAEIELSLRQLDAAAEHAGKLIEASPHDPGHRALLAVVLGSKAQFTSESVVRIGKWRAALQAVRKAQELGGGAAPLTILESQLLWNLEEFPGAEGVLQKALGPVTEIKSAELGLFLALLRIQCLSRQGKAVGRTLQRIGSLLPEDPARRASIGGEIQELAEEMALNHPAEAKACLELAAQACPEDPTIGMALAACDLRQEEIKKKALRIGELAARPTPGSRRARTPVGGLSRGAIGFLIFLLITAMNLSRTCSNHNPGELRPQRFAPPLGTPAPPSGMPPGWKLRPEDLDDPRRDPLSLPGLSPGGAREWTPVLPLEEDPLRRSGSAANPARSARQGGVDRPGGAIGPSRPDGTRSR